MSARVPAGLATWFETDRDDARVQRGTVTYSFAKGSELALDD
jgi:hypothetical protein